MASSPASSAVEPTTAAPAERPSVEAGERPSHRLYFYGSGADLFGVHAVNVLLTLLTLGVFHRYYRLPQSRDVRSAMYGPIWDLDDLGRIGEEF